MAIVKAPTIQALAKAAVTEALSGTGLTVKGSGVATPFEAAMVSTETGYWANKVSSKPPRLLLHVDNSTGTPVVSFAKQADGDEFTTSRILGGGFNTRDGTDIAFICIIRAIECKPGVPVTYGTIPIWEWVLVLVLDRPLPNGTSGEIISDFDPATRQFTYKEKQYIAAKVALITKNPDNDSLLVSGKPTTYAAVTEGIVDLMQLRPAEDAEAQA